MIKKLLVLASVLALPATALADGASLKQFFKNAEGNWRGAGQIQSMDGMTGNIRSDVYTQALDVVSLGNDSWAVETRTTDADGKTLVLDAKYMVHGDHLYYYDELTTIAPVDVTLSGNDQLNYDMELLDMTGVRPYTRAVQMTVQGGKLTMTVSKIVNGVMTTQDTYQADKQ